MSSSMADEHRARIEVFEYTAVEVIIHFYGVRGAGKVFICTVPEKYLYIGLHLSNTFPGQKKAIVVFKYTSPALEKYLYTSCRISIYTLLRRRRSIYMHPILSIVWHCVLGNAPSYLLELFILASACFGRRSLCSASKGDFLVPRARTATGQKRAFSIVGLSVWNCLQFEPRPLPLDLSSSFYQLLKTLLFDRAWAWSASE